MANGIIPVSWGKELRPSAVNTLDKINEVIHFINQSEIHEFTFSDSGSGESVQTANSTQLMNLTVYGKSVQDGTPAPENPVEVQVVGGRNIWHDAQAKWINQDGSISDQQGEALIVVLPVLAGNSYTLSFSNVMTAQNVGCIAFYSGEPSASTKLTRTAKTSGNSLTATAPANAVYMAAGAYRALQVGNIQLEAGTQATPYTPYGCIGLKIGETVTPIDLQGHTLAGLPDGTRDELDINAAGIKDIEQRVGITVIDGVNVKATGYSKYGTNLRVNITLPNQPNIQVTERLNCYTNKLRVSAEPINTPSADSAEFTFVLYTTFSFAILPISAVSAETTAAINEWFAANPVTVYYPLATPTKIELGTITTPAIPDGSIITIDANLTPTIDVKWFTENTLPEMMNLIIGLIKSLHPDDFQANRLNTNIVHSINPVDISDIQPISDIKPIKESENENESEG